MFGSVLHSRQLNFTPAGNHWIQLMTASSCDMSVVATATETCSDEELYLVIPSLQNNMVLFMINHCVIYIYIYHTQTLKAT